MKFLRVIAHTLFYPSLGWTILLGRILKLRSWWSYIDDNVILGALPLARDLEHLKKAGVGAVLNLCEECGEREPFYRRNNIDYLKLPVIDFTSPDIKTVRKGVEFIEECLSQSKRVYVHCKAGRGRSATVVLCWLMHSRNMCSAEAMQLLLKKRPHINKNLRRRYVVKQFENI